MPKIRSSRTVSQAARAAKSVGACKSCQRRNLPGLPTAAAIFLAVAWLVAVSLQAWHKQRIDAEREREAKSKVPSAVERYRAAKEGR